VLSRKNDDDVIDIKEGYRQDTPMGKGYAISNPQPLKSNPVQEGLNNAELARVSKELHDSKSKHIKDIEYVDNKLTDFHGKAKNAFGILLNDNNHFRNRLDYFENQQPPRFNQDTVVMDPSIVKYKIDDDDDDDYNPNDLSYANHVVNTHEELQEKLGKPNVGYSKDDDIDVFETGGDEDFKNTTKHELHSHDTQFIDSSVAGGSLTDPVVGFIGDMLGLKSPPRYPQPPTISTDSMSLVRDKPEARGTELDLTPNTAAQTEFTPVRPLSVKERAKEINESERKRKEEYNNRKHGQPTPQPQSPPPRPQSPPPIPQSYEDEDEDEEILPKGKGKVNLEKWKKILF
jgi:hypothetical protein